jgi:ATP-dependent Clp protease ATP-binding subunit ClpB
MEDMEKTERNRRVMEALRGHFRPEFLNRIDEIIIFDRLDDRQITHIVGIQLQRLLSRLEKQNIRLELTDAAKKLLAKEGYDPAYGARPLKRVIQREILDPLSLDILDGKFGEGDRIVADAQGAAGPGETDHLVFRKA